MKYNDVVTLGSNGVMGLTSHSLSINSAYTVTKFKREITKLFEEWVSKFNSLTGEAGIEDGEAFDKRRSELTTKMQGGTLSNSEAKELDDIKEKFKRLQALREKLSEESVELNITPMPYEDWHTFKTENKDLKTNGGTELLEMVEVCLEGILWAPLVEPEQG